MATKIGLPEMRRLRAVELAVDVARAGGPVHNLMTTAKEIEDYLAGRGAPAAKKAKKR